MPPTYSIWNTTTIILVDGNFNIVRGNFRHLDARERESTAITNTDSFNVLESTVTGQSLLSTTSRIPTIPVPSNSPGEHPATGSGHDTNTRSEAPYQPVDVEVTEQSTMETTSRDEEHSSLLHQSTTEASEPQLSLSPPLQSIPDERTTIGRQTLTKTNRLKSIHSKIKDWLKTVITFMIE